MSSGEGLGRGKPFLGVVVGERGREQDRSVVGEREERRRQKAISKPPAAQRAGGITGIG